MSSTIYKVTAIITRQPPGKQPPGKQPPGKQPPDKPPELLVFQHPNAGVQLPAGTIEAGETPEEAVLRETAEETGLTAVQLRQPLGKITQTLPQNSRVVMRNSPLFIGPSPQAQTLNFILCRGYPVRLISQMHTFSEISFEENNINVSPTQVITRISGWLPSNLLASKMERHFFHLTPTGPTPESWDVFADKHKFQLYWVPLIPRPMLVHSQNHWLDGVDVDKLVHS